MADLILGLCAFLHDSSASLFVDGKFVGFSEEDKLVQEKHYGGFPQKTIDWLLNQASATYKSVGAVGYYWNGQLIAEAFAAGDRSTQPRGGESCEYYKKILSRHQDRTSKLSDKFPNAKIFEIPHHRSHGLYAFCASPYPEAAVITIDSLGEGISTTIAEVKDGKYRELLRIHDPHSLGFLYGAVCEHLGYRRNDEEGTIMALAGYGDAKRYKPLLDEIVRLDPKGFSLDTAFLHSRASAAKLGSRLSDQFVQRSFPRRPHNTALLQEHADLAASLQEKTKEAIFHLVGLAHNLTRLPFLCVSGGVALNCAAMGYIRARGPFSDVFVPPAPGDTGTAIGAALGVMEEQYGSLPKVNLPHRSGPSLKSNQVADYLVEKGIGFSRLVNVSAHVAAELAKGKIVALFEGPQEIGPRALGARSILAPCFPEEMRGRINEKIKLRETFRPVAPIVLRERMRDWFEFDWDCKYMSFAVPVREKQRALIPSALHVDGTARVQTVDRADFPLLHEVLAAYERITGIPVLLNTSLNLKGKPTASDIDAAMSCFAAGDIDAIVIEDLIVTQ
ncbi:carbamoyltransferase [Agrobacterium tumefaciens]|uniref:carbamoyltransferase family protein n=1 Tax=Agrobacterium tumefaciens TaxID=358 RepID=UPI0012BA0DD6|nr:carbamoyltransferase C-terminal domain-containing protein [Agrobacterium tumefaciens]MQB08163.1 carbamoyltransferase [Agrobacterium tumefaciens]